MLKRIFPKRHLVPGLVLFVCLSAAFAPPMAAQASGMGALTGRVIDASGNAIASAIVTATSAENGQSRSATTGTDGTYKVDLPSPGTYQVKFEAAGFKTVEIPSVTLNGTETTVVDRKLETGEPPNSKPTPASQENLPNAPSSTKTEPSLGDLGFPPEETKGDTKQQALLDKRTHMLKIHQRLGLITTAPLLATLITSVNAGGKNPSSTDRYLHTALGSVTADMYFITAYYAIRAPRVRGTETRGPIRVHKALAWVHGPGMILTPILGILAYDQKSKGEKVHGIASAHGPVAIVTAGAFGAALLSVSLKF